MQNTVKVLVCDDQQIIHDTLKKYIEAEGFSCISAFDGEEAMQKFAAEKPDFIVLDLMMPKKNGIDVCRDIRKESTIPIIMLTAKGEEIDRILGLELGADDYIVKPFSPREVVARIKVVLRRLQDQPTEATQKILRFPSLEINISCYEVVVNGAPVPCTPKEAELLYKLAISPGQVFNREQLLESVWGYDYYGDTRVVDAQIKRLRQHLGENEHWSIRSIYGVGYKFEVKAL